MRFTLLPAVVVAFTAPLLAQKTAEAAPKSGAAAAYTALVEEYDAATAVAETARGEIAKTDEFKKASKARDREAMTALMADVTPVDYASFRERFLAGAKTYAGTDDAIDFLTWVAMKGNDKDAQTAAAYTLLDDHIKSPKLITIAESVGYLARPLGADGLQEFCERLAEESPDNMVRAWAMYARASAMSRGRDVPDDVKAEADALLAEAEKLAEGTLLADRIAGPRFVEERLQIGMEVPDIVGEDLDGVPFKLSDYRGKVVVIDFWGDW